MDGWVIIGISGVTCGGKTTLARRLQSSIANVKVINQDTYFLPDDSPLHVKCDGLEHNNYDILSSLDMDAMYRDVQAILRNEAVHYARVSSIVDTSHPTFEIPHKNVLVIEGFTVLNYMKLFQLCNLKYYITLEYGECVSRRINRLYDPPDVPGYFDSCVWPEHLQYRAEMEDKPSVRFLDGTDPNNFDYVLQDLRGLGLIKIS